MKSLKRFIVTVFSGALACAGLCAQTTGMRANIPFVFYAGNTLMPAGEYRIQEEGPWVVLRVVDGGHPVATLLSITTTSQYPPRAGQLVFHRYGNSYFLATVWNSYSQDGREVPPSAGEKLLARKNRAPVQAAIVVASNE